MSRSSILLIGALALVVVLARVFATGSGTEPDRPPAAETARVIPTAAAMATPGRDAERAAAPPGLVAGERDPDEKFARSMTAEKARETAAKLRHRARFPPTSRRIEDNMDPIVRTRAVKERFSPPGQGRKPTLVLYASATSYEAPNPVILFAKFIGQYPDDWSTRTDAEIAGDLRNADGEVVAEVDLVDDGTGRDLEAGDGTFTAQLDPAPEDLERWNGLIRVEVYGKTGTGDRRDARTRFYYGTPGAKLTGNYRDALVDGHLEILAEVDAKQLGEYHLEATLSSSQGLLAWAQKTAMLEPGVTWIPLTFWGLAFREAGQPGPYRLSSIALSNVTLKPPQMNDAFATQYETAPYKVDDFSTKSFDDPKLLERAGRYDERGRGD